MIAFKSMLFYDNSFICTHTCIYMYIHIICGKNTNSQFTTQLALRHFLVQSLLVQTYRQEVYCVDCFCLIASINKILFYKFMCIVVVINAFKLVWKIWAIHFLLQYNFYYFIGVNWLDFFSMSKSDHNICLHIWLEHYLKI